MLQIVSEPAISSISCVLPCSNKDHYVSAKSLEICMF